MIKVNLIGSDGTLHSIGELPASLLNNLNLVKRNNRIYYFYGFNSTGLQFIECEQPYEITEF